MISTEKPKFGASCNHCGLCCIREVCLIGKIILGGDAKAPCKLITDREGKFLCAAVLTERENNLEPVFQKILGIGFGCSMTDDETTDEEIEKFDRMSKEKLSKFQNPELLKRGGE